MKSKYIWFFIVLFSFGSCESLLDPELDNRITEDEMLRIPQFAEGLLLNAYKNLPDKYDFNEAIICDEAVTNNLNSEFIKLASGEWSAEDNPLNNWNSAFTQIYYLNLFLSKSPNVKWSENNSRLDSLHLQRLTGEAYGLRAWYELQLLKYHAGEISDGSIRGFPIQVRPLGINDDWKQERNYYEECIERIAADCDSAIKYLPLIYSNTGDNIYDQAMGTRWTNRITGMAAHAIKSRALLFAASPAFNPDQDIDLWEKAAMQAGLGIVINGGISALSQTGINFYKYKSGNDPDVIWANAISMGIELEKENFPPSLFGNGRINPTQELVDAFPMENGFPINHPESGFSPMTPYYNRDPRLSEYILFNGNNLGFKGEIFTHKASVPDGINSQTNSTRTGYYLKKLLLDNVNIENPLVEQNHFYTYFRITELFLNYAEAANEAWGPDGNGGVYDFTARDAIAAIRNRAGIISPDTYLNSITDKSGFRELIRNERRLELCFEGHRFWDIRRWKEIETMNMSVSGVVIDTLTNSYSYSNVEVRSFEDYMIYGPIPLIEILKYDELTQNIGW